MFLSQRIQTMGESATLKMAQLARELAAEGHQVINMSLGEPDFDTPEVIKDAAKQALDEGYTKYTPVVGLLELRKAIAEKLRRDNGLTYGTHEIIVSNGAKQSFANLCMALLDPGDEVILLAPYWVSYKEIVAMSGATPVMVYAGIEQEYKVSAEQVKAAITPKTKLIVFSSPCNPTGSVFNRAELEALAEVVKQVGREDLLLVSDEIYEYIYFGQEPLISVASLPGMAERTIVINGFSKGFAMTGWRLGYLAAPQWVVDACAKMQGQFTSGASSFGQKAGAEAVLKHRQLAAEMSEVFQKRRDLILELLAQVPGFKLHNPQGAFYVFPDVSAFFGRQTGEHRIETAKDLAYYLLHQAHVALVDGAAFGAPNCIRFSYATSEAQIREAVRRIAEAVARLQ